ncbi:MATE family efflux transporter [Euzebya tangerina]|uniref:MATE family efflux transporter n=1 Tax=Euzebya tangerina TaxID=591198 RepID=UPI000E3118B8|nr:MATE family efflux transporter [Euzebya tangerina]
MRSSSPHDREIARLAVPALGALVAEPLYVLADTAVVGRISTEALAGLAIASAALLSGFAIFIFLAYGTTAAVSRLLGADRPDEAAHQAVQSLWLAVLIGVAVTAVGAAFAGPIIRGLAGDAAPAVIDQALTYFRVSLAGVPFQLLVFSGTGYLRGLQDTVTPLVVAVVAAVGNLVLELVLVVGLDFGIGASALSTVIAQGGSAAVFVGLILRATGALHVSRRPDPRTILRLARVGGDLLVRTIALRAAVTVSTAVAARIGTVEVAAHEVVFAIWALLALALDALAIAGQALVGRFLGAGDGRAAREVGQRMLVLGAAFGVLLGGVLAVASPVLPQLFTEDDAVAATATTLLLVAAVSQPVNGLAFVLDGLLIGAGDLAFLAKAMVGAAAIMAVLAAVVLAADAGIVWLWVAIGAFMAARAAPLWLRWRTGAWAVTGA